MNILSLFDGMSCGQIVLNRIGIKPANYYAAEVDKYAIKVTQANYPNTEQMGDVTKWREWDIDWASIDLLIGGSPCQGFSFAGKQLAFDDPRSKLFFVYVDILNHIRSVNPRVKFMLENVKMKKEYLAIISDQLGTEPVFINSALLSAQNRQRYYWCNWFVEQPEDKGILLADILEREPENTTFMSDKFTTRNKAAGCLRDDLSGKAKSLSAMEYVKNGRQGDYINPAAIVGRKLDENGKRNDTLNQKPVQCLEAHEHGKSRCLSTVAKDTVVSGLPAGRYPIKTVEFNDRIKGVTEDDRGFRYHRGDKAKSGITELGRVLKVKATHTDTVTTSYTPKLALNNEPENLSYRKLTPIECERLQTVPDNYTNHVSNTQRYKMIGNGWTIDVIAHIFKQGLTQ